MTDFPEYDTEKVNIIFSEWINNKIADPITFRDHRHTSAITGTISEEVKIPWADN